MTAAAIMTMDIAGPLTEAAASRAAAEPTTEHLRMMAVAAAAVARDWLLQGDADMAYRTAWRSVAYEREIRWRRNEREALR